MLYREALNKALDEMMEKDETVVVLGEDVVFTEVITGLPKDCMRNTEKKGL